MSGTDSDVRWNDNEAFIGCRNFPKIDAVRQAIGITREAFEQLQRLKSDPAQRHLYHNTAVLHVVWHQQFAIAARSSRHIYIPRSSVSKDGLVALSDKDNRNGYKCRFLRFPPMLLHQMKILESVAHWKFRSPASRGRPRYEIDEVPHFKSIPGGSEMRFEDISRDGILRVSEPFFRFPINTPRRVMRYMLWERELSPEYVDVFMGHWRERQEPWGRWSSLSYGHYLHSIKALVPSILEDLGFDAVGNHQRD